MKLVMMESMAGRNGIGSLRLAIEWRTEMSSTSDACEGITDRGDDGGASAEDDSFFSVV